MRVAVIETFAELAERIMTRPPRLGPVRLVAIDGPSAAGKTRFAAGLAAALRSVTVVHTDDLLDGWDDQFTFWGRLEAQVLDPLRHGRPGRYQRYLWRRRSFGGEPVIVAPSGVVLLEGVSAARAVVRPELSLSVFVTAPTQVRWRRALVRHVDAPGAVAPDRVAARAYLERWRAAEDQHFAADSTAEHVDLLVDGAAQPDEEDGQPDEDEGERRTRSEDDRIGIGDGQTAAAVMQQPTPADRYVRLAALREQS